MKVMLNSELKKSSPYLIEGNFNFSKLAIQIATNLPKFNVPITHSAQISIFIAISIELNFTKVYFAICNLACYLPKFSPAKVSLYTVVQFSHYTGLKASVSQPVSQSINQQKIPLNKNFVAIGSILGSTDGTFGFDPILPGCHESIVRLVSCQYFS